MKKLALLVPLLLASQFALAEGSGIPGTDETSANTSTVDNAWKATVGGGLGSVPRYEGAATNRLRAIPLFDIQNGHFFAGTSRGVGYDFSEDQSIQYGPRLTLAPHRKQALDARLNGTGDIAAAAELGGFVNARFAPWYVTSSLAASSRGARMELGGGYELQLSSDDKVRAGVEMNWANGKYMQTYFGVTPTQAAASAGVLTAYNATSGVKDYALKLNWMHNYSKQWFSNAGVSVKQLAGSAKNSPLTMRNTTNTVNFVVGYHF
jgi:outer membrane protein